MRNSSRTRVAATLIAFISGAIGVVLFPIHFSGSNELTTEGLGMLLWIVSFPLSLATYVVMTLLPMETRDNNVVGVVVFVLTYFGQWQGIAAFFFWRAARMERDENESGLPTV